MKKLNVQLKLVSHITITVTIVTVFMIGTWLQWQLTEKNSTMPSLQSETIALAKLISGVDLLEPSQILANETAALDQHRADHHTDVALSESEIASIVDEVTLAQPQDMTVLEPVLTDMEASFKTNKRVFIYHTHAREGWHHEETSDKNANSKDINITLLGQKLAEELAQKGIGSVVSTTDYATAVPDYEWAYSYKYSRKSVKEILATQQDIDMIFDIHRDSQVRKYTTATIDGQDYAQVYFIIGKRNENWEQNEAFAEKLNKKIEQLYPGLSRGIWGKNANSGNGEYNQSLHSKNILVEVGGVDNTLEENYRTMKALAHAISEIAKEDEQ